MLSYEGGVDNVVLKEMAAKPQIWYLCFDVTVTVVFEPLNTLKKGKGVVMFDVFAGLLIQKAWSCTRCWAIQAQGLHKIIQHLPMKSLTCLITPWPIITEIQAPNSYHLASRADSSSKLRGNVLPVCFSILVGPSAMRQAVESKHGDTVTSCYDCQEALPPWRSVAKEE